MAGDACCRQVEQVGWELFDCCLEKCVDMGGCKMAFGRHWRFEVGTDEGVWIGVVEVDVGEASDDGCNWANVESNAIVVDNCIAFASFAVVKLEGSGSTVL